MLNYDRRDNYKDVKITLSLLGLKEISQGKTALEERGSLPQAGVQTLLEKVDLKPVE